jgi:hypothetical protein
MLQFPVLRSRLSGIFDLERIVEKPRAPFDPWVLEARDKLTSSRHELQVCLVKGGSDTVARTEARFAKLQAVCATKPHVLSPVDDAYVVPMGSSTSQGTAVLVSPAASITAETFLRADASFFDTVDERLAEFRALRECLTGGLRSLHSLGIVHGRLSLRSLQYPAAGDTYCWRLGGVAAGVLAQGANFLADWRACEALLVQLAQMPAFAPSSAACLSMASDGSMNAEPTPGKARPSAVAPFEARHVNTSAVNRTESWCDTGVKEGSICLGDENSAGRFVTCVRRTDESAASGPAAGAAEDAARLESPEMRTPTPIATEPAPVKSVIASPSNERSLASPDALANLSPDFDATPDSALRRLNAAAAWDGFASPVGESTCRAKAGVPEQVEYASPLRSIGLSLSPARHFWDAASPQSAAELAGSGPVAVLCSHGIRERFRALQSDAILTRSGASRHQQAPVVCCVVC